MAEQPERHKPAEDSSGKPKKLLTRNEKIHNSLIGFARRWIAVGMLVAFTTNLNFTLIQGALYEGTCAVPFFIVRSLPCGVFGPC